MTAYCSILDTLLLPALKRYATALVLQTLRSDKTLDLGGLGVGFLPFTLWLDFTADDELADIIFLGQPEEPPDLGCPLSVLRSIKRE